MYRRKRELAQRVVMPAFGSSLEQRIDQVCYMKLPGNHSQQRRTKLQATPYFKENQRLQKAIQSRIGSFAKKGKLRSQSIEVLVERYRGQKLAAFRVQRFFHLVKVKQYWADICRKSQAAIVIQKHFRRFLATLLTRRYLQRQQRLVLRLQAAYRGYRSRKRTYILFYVKSKRIILLQSIIRRYFARLHLFHLRLHKAAKVIQAVLRRFILYREAKQRHHARAAVVIQRFSRGLLARGKVIVSKTERVCAATVIQGVVRVFLARKGLVQQLTLRRFQDRKDRLNVAKQDMLYVDSLVQRKRTELLSLLKEVDNQAEVGKLCMMRAEIKEKEVDLISMHHELVLLTPQDVERGWKTEVLSYIKEHREMVTRLKLNYLFGSVFEYRKRQDRVQNLEREVNRLERQRRRLGEDRESHFLVCSMLIARGLRVCVVPVDR